MSIVQPPDDVYAYPSLALDPEKLLALLKSEQDAGTQYGLGSKISPLSLQAVDDAWPGRVDCSGEFRWLLYHALGMPEGFDVPDGSVNQHAWLVQNGFKCSDWRSGLLLDGYIRVGVLGPHDTSEGIGHIWMTYMGMTIESHGSHGPDSRSLADAHILHNDHWFVLTPPKK